MSGLKAKLFFAIAGTAIGGAAVAAIALVITSVFRDPPLQPPTLTEEILAIALFAGIMLIAIAWDVFLVVEASVNKPARSLSKSLRQMTDGNFDVPIAPASGSALAGLTDELETMRRATGTVINDLKAKNDDLTHDVTEIMEKLGNAALDLMEANEIKDRFLGMAAHDLRNPINAVRMMSDMLSTMDLKDEIKAEMYLNINRSALQMQALINDLLDVSAIESGTFHMSPVVANLKSEIEDRVRILEMTAQNKKMKITVTGEDVPDSQFDTNRIGQVFENLVTNAIKFSPPGSDVTIDVFHDTDAVGFSVADQGPGIPDNERDRLFQEFAKLSNEPTAGESSTGLGLSIVKKIVSSHNGRIDVDSKVGNGTRFTVRLPKRLVSGAEDAATEHLAD